MARERAGNQRNGQVDPVQVQHDGSDAEGGDHRSAQQGALREGEGDCGHGPEPGDSGNAGPDTAGPLAAVLDIDRRVTAGIEWRGDESDRIRKRYPTLWAYLSAAKDGQGNKRAAPRIVLSLTNCGVQCSLENPNIGYKVQAACESIEEVWGALERELFNPKARWSEMTWGDGFNEMEKERLKKKQLLTKKK